MAPTGNNLKKGIIMKLKEIKEFVLDLIFPKECLGCGKENTYLCRQCYEKIALNKNFYCALCKRESDLAKICLFCQKESALSAIWVAADYNNDILQALIHNLKYKYLEDLSQVLADLIIKYLEEQKIFQHFEINNENTIITPVPLHNKRLLLRGFNQSDLLAEKISSFYKIKKLNLLNRKINTHSQIELKRKERQQNVKAAFIFNANESLDKNKKIILMDDVVTTGSTLNECAKVLSENGFEEIYGLVIAQRED